MVNKTVFSTRLVIILFSLCRITGYNALVVNIQRSKRQLYSGTKNDDFICQNGQRISKYGVCDGSKDCSDGSDEIQAICLKYNIPCRSYSFRCAYGACIDGNKECDGKWDCADGSDELQKHCKNFIWANGSNKCSNGFQCRDGQCIGEFLECDGIPHCNDGSDESVTICNVRNISCPGSAFRCAYGACIDGSLKCNSVKNCADNSDENYILCGYDPPTTEANKPTETTSNVPDRLGDKCRIPSHLGTKYKKCENIGSNCVNEPPGKMVNLYYFVNIECEEGYGNDLETTTCIEGGEWSAGGCYKLCKPIDAPSLSIICEYEGTTVPCNTPSRPGTIANIKCKIGFIQSSLGKNLCQDNGEWLYQIPSCTYTCGTIGDNSPLIENGKEANISSHPWVTLLYKYDPEEKGFIFLCGGTLISPYVVLSAAHCVIDPRTKNLFRDPFKIGLGKELNSFNATEANAQMIDVASIHVPSIYSGRRHQFLGDISVIELKSPPQFSKFVKPACIDTTYTYQVTESTLGTIAGFGLDGPGGSPTLTLNEAELPYISFNQCISLLAQSEYLLAQDKFCASYTNGTTTNVHQGDSGSGLLFKFDNQYFVFGVVSTKISVKSINSFTNITDREILPRIVTFINNIHRQHNINGL